MERDPVCGMMVDPDHAAATIDHAGKTYFFCSAGCAGKFGTDPEKYLAAPQLAQPARQADLVQFDDIRPVPSHTADSVEYTCPMHPQIVRPGPGSCPICGMALEPRTAAAEDGENPELVSMTRRFWVSVALAIPDPRAWHVRHDSGRARATSVVDARDRMDSVRSRDPGCPLGRMAILRTRMGVARQSQFEHVYADRPRHRHGVYLQH